MATWAGMAAGLVHVATTTMGKSLQRESVCHRFSWTRGGREGGGGEGGRGDLHCGSSVIFTDIEHVGTECRRQPRFCRGQRLNHTH